MGTEESVKQSEELTVSLARGAVNNEGAAVAHLTAQAQGIVLETAGQVEAAGPLLLQITGRKKAMAALRLSITRPMDEAKKAVMLLFAPAIEGLQNAEDAIKGGVLAYQQAQQRARAEEQRRLDAEAEEERKNLLTRGAMERDIGQEDRAEELEAQSDEVKAPIVAPAEKLTGPVHTRVTWSAEVTDLQALAMACGAGRVALALILPNMPALNAMARVEKGDMDIPGVRAVSEEHVAARGS